jgi:prevent-host-death family protein
MAHLSTVEARSQFAELINRVAYGKERVILTRRGKALVAVVPLEDLPSDLIETSAITVFSIAHTDQNDFIA